MNTLHGFPASLILMMMLMVTPGVSQAEQTTEVYNTNLPANKLLPVIQPLLGPDDRITAYHNKLFIKALPAQQQEVLEVLDEVDRLPKNIIISTRYSEDMELTRKLIAAEDPYFDPDASQQDKQEIKVYRGSSQNSTIEVEMMNRRRFSTAYNQADQQIRVLEGEQGILNMGEERDVADMTWVSPFGSGTTQQRKSVDNVLYVIPSLTKDRVRLEVFVTNQAFRGGDQKIKKTSAQSVLLLTPGIWTPLASGSQSRTSSGNGVSLNTGAVKSHSGTLLIKADFEE